IPSLIILPNLVNALPKQLLEIVIRVTILHLPIKLPNKPFLKPHAILQKPSRNIIPLVPPLTVPRTGPPNHSLQSSLHPHVIRNPTNQPNRSLTHTIPSPNLNQLIIQHPSEFPLQVSRRIVPNVLSTDRDPVVHVVNRLLHVLNQQLDSPIILPVTVGVGLVEGLPYEVGCRLHLAAGVALPDPTDEALDACGGVRRCDCDWELYSLG
ncbi:hypothetical protein LINPERPRIM_LOCUS16063, partial [Linum perenne]